MKAAGSTAGFLCESEAIDAVTDDAQMFEREPIEALVKRGEVHAFFHHGFWQAMDTLRDKQHLEELWAERQGAMEDLVKRRLIERHGRAGGSF